MKRDFRDRYSPQEFNNVIESVVRRHIEPRLIEMAQRTMEDELENKVELVLSEMLEIDVRARIKRRVDGEAS